MTVQLRQPIDLSGVDMEKLRAQRAAKAEASRAAWAVAREFVRPSSIVWRITEGEDGMLCDHNVADVRVICSASVEDDGKRWLHVSVSHKRHIPGWDWIKQVKSEFIGDDRKAIQVLPAASEYVNINAFVLHLWHCMDGDTLPDFTGGTGSI